MADQAGKGVSGNFADLVAAVTESSATSIKSALLGTLRVTTDHTREEAVWLLLTRSLVHALNVVSDEFRVMDMEGDFLEDDEFDLPGFIVDSLEEVIVVEAELVTAPGSLGWVLRCADDLQRRLESAGTISRIAAWASARLSFVFARSVREELLDASSFYAKVLSETAVDDAVVHSMQWDSHHDSIWLEAGDMVFNTTVPLKDIYISPRARLMYAFADLHPSGWPSPLAAAPMFGVLEQEAKFEVYPLHSALHDWVDNTRDGGGMWIVCGDPGCGKSSFATMFAKECVERGRKTLLLRLVDLPKYTGEEYIRDIVDTQLRQWNAFSSSPFEKKRDSAPFVVILDGLDELTGPMDGAEDLAATFMSGVLQLVKNQRKADCPVHVIVTGRTMLFSGAGFVSSREGKCPLVMLPYIVEEEEDVEFYNPLDIIKAATLNQVEQEEWGDFVHRKGWLSSPSYLEEDEIDEEGEVDDAEEKRWLAYFDGLGVGELARRLIEHVELTRRDDRERWWIKWGELTGSGHEEVPFVIIANDELSQISMEPLLNLLVAFIYENRPISIFESLTANHLYKEVFDDFYERQERKEDDYFLKICPTRESFDALLEEVACVGWKNGNERRVAMKHLSEGNKSKLESLSREDIGISRVLLLFYFARSIHEDQECIEFTHKTFAEYLVAKAMVREVEAIHEAFNAGWNNSEADIKPRMLVRWADFFGGMEMTLVIHTFFVNEVDYLAGNDFDRELISMKDQRRLLANRKNKPVDEWHQTLTTLFQYAVESGIPMDLCGGGGSRPSFEEERHRSRCAAVNLLAACSACAGAAESQTFIDVGDKPALLADWLRRHAGAVRAEVDGADAGVVMSSSRLVGHSCTRMNFSQQDFTGSDFMFMDVSDSLFEKSILAGANLDFVTAVDAWFRDAVLQYASALGAQLDSAKLHNVQAVVARFNGACLNDAVCQGANFSGSSFRDAEFVNAKCMSVNFSKCDLTAADFRGANLTNADFSGAILDGAQFKGAIFKNTTFDEGVMETLDV
jgi:uncharacterized protein YjbI with pentapeptide repeats